MAGRPQWMGLIERAVVEDHFVNGAGRDKDAARHAGVERILKQPQRAREVDAEEDIRGAVTATPSVARTFPLHRGVNEDIGAFYEGASCGGIAEVARQPFDGIRFRA